MSFLSQTSPCLQHQSLENTVGKGEIAHNEQISSNLKLSSVNSFRLEESEIYCLGMGIMQQGNTQRPSWLSPLYYSNKLTWNGPWCNNILTHYQTTNFRLFQTERVSRRQFQIWQKWQKVIQMGRKHCEKRRNCSLPAISPFPTVFSKGLFPKGVKRCYCVGMGYEWILNITGYN